MKTWIKVIALASATFLMTNCIRNQTYVVTQPSSAPGGDTIAVKIFHRSFIWGPLDTAKHLKEEIRVTTLSFWMGNSAGHTIVAKSARIFGYKLPQFDSSIMTLSDLDSNSKILRPKPIPDTMTARLVSAPNSMFVRDAANKRDTLLNDGKDSGIVWQHRSGDIRFARSRLGVLVTMDTIVFKAGEKPDTIIGAYAGFAIGAEIDMLVKVGPFKIGKVNNNIYYFTKARATIKDVNDTVSDTTIGSFGAWSTLNITPVLPIQQRVEASKALLSYSGNNLQFQWNEMGRNTIQIFDTRGTIIRNGLSNQGQYILNKTGIAPGSYFFHVNSEKQPLTQKFFVP